MKRRLITSMLFLMLLVGVLAGCQKEQPAKQNPFIGTWDDYQVAYFEFYEENKAVQGFIDGSRYVVNYNYDDKNLIFIYDNSYTEPNETIPYKFLNSETLLLNESWIFKKVS